MPDGCGPSVNGIDATSRAALAATTAGGRVRLFIAMTTPAVVTTPANAIGATGSYACRETR